jgi:hypothetical protein
MLEDHAHPSRATGPVKPEMAACAKFTPNKNNNTNKNNFTEDIDIPA